MPWLSRLARRMRLAADRPAAERDMDEEMRLHLDAAAEELERERGLTPAEARREALLAFGGVERFKEEGRDARGGRWLDDLRQDLRFGVRSARRAPLFALLVVATLALGIGANAAVFGVVKSVLLDPLPYADAGRLVRVHASKKDGTFDRLTLSAGAVVDVAERQRSFSDVGVFLPFELEVAYVSDGGPRPLSGALAGFGFFQTLGVPAALGRTLGADDVQSGAPPAAVMSHAAWQRLFGGDSSVIGRPIQLNGAAYDLVGVLPASFISPMGEIDVWMPLDLAPHLQDPVRVRRRSWLGLVARLAPGVSLDAAQRELAAMSVDFEREHPGPDGDALVSMTVIPLRDDMVGDTRTQLLVLMASAGLVLLIACANLAGALLSRMLSRRREFAVRLALGAGRTRLIRQLVTESTMLALAGGALGVLLAVAALGALRGLAIRALPSYADLTLDPGTVAAAAVLALVTGIVLGLAPALSVGRGSTQATLREEGRGSSESRRSRHLRGALVAGQIALSVSMLAGAGLLVRSLVAMTGASLGFDPASVLTATIQLPDGRYGSTAARIRFHEQLTDRLRAVPGVRDAAIASARPGAVLSNEGFSIEGRQSAPGDAKPFVLYASVSDGYFTTLGIPLLRGRTFETSDRTDAPPVVVISDAMARRHWPAGDAIGARVRLGPDPDAPAAEVVGVVGDVRNGIAVLDAEPIVYASARRDPWVNLLLVRTERDPLAVVRSIERELAGLDPTLPLHDVATLPALLADGMAGRRLPTLLVAGFGMLALLLASVGVYAMFAAMVAAREREFGIRLALGSSPREIAGLVLRAGALWMAVGLVIGAGGVMAVARLVRGLLYGVPAFDPVSLGGAVLVLLGCAGVALLVPIRRATHVDPIAAMRG